jgi:hypothetical protein
LAFISAWPQLNAYRCPPDSSVRMVPIRGSVTWRRSRSINANTPVVNRHDMPCRLPVNRGNRTVGPRRLPGLEAFQRGMSVAPPRIRDAVSYRAGRWQVSFSVET